MRLWTALRRWLESSALSNLAMDAAALAVALHPEARFPELLQSVVATLATMSGRVRDRAALERAAAGALARLGRLPASR